MNTDVVWKLQILCGLVCLQLRKVGFFTFWYLFEIFSYIKFINKLIIVFFKDYKVYCNKGTLFWFIERKKALEKNCKTTSLHTNTSHQQLKDSDKYIYDIIPKWYTSTKKCNWPSNLMLNSLPKFTHQKWQNRNLKPGLTSNSSFSHNKHSFSFHNWYAYE
jgi:hypothetical protein